MTELNDAQKAAAEHFTGPALTLAGPGSGKTRVMTERTILLSKRIREPDGILSVTFTNAAADEMRERFHALCGMKNQRDSACGPVFKTVHSYSNALISKYEQISNTRYKRIDGTGGGKAELLGKIYEEINGDKADPYILGQINSTASGRAAPEIKNYRSIIRKYNEYKKANKCIDFDDMITMALSILNSDRSIEKYIREREQEQFRFIQIDEAQDLTKAQFDVLQIIGANGNIFVVADDDQSIYGFRGAAPSCLAEFVDRNKNCKIYNLSRNYRSSQSIVNISGKFISKNSGRFEKDLYSENEKGIIPRIKACADCTSQMQFVYKEIKRLRRKNSKPAIGILYRNNISGLFARAFLMHNDEQYSADEGSEQIKNIAFMDRILNEIRNAERTSAILLPTPDKTFRKMLENGLEKDFDAHCRKTRQHMRYKDAVISLIYYLCSVCDSWSDMVHLSEAIDTHAKCGGDIFLSTVHASKGLEYDAVFIIDAIMGEFPGNGAAVGTELEEERRLFYVAMTRAKKYLYVTYPVRRGNPYLNKEKQRESVFVSEMRECIRTVK